LSSSFVQALAATLFWSQTAGIYRSEAALDTLHGNDEAMKYQFKTNKTSTQGPG
jgi:hypothetical protein